MIPSKRQREVLVVMAAENVEIKSSVSGLIWTLPMASGRITLKVPPESICAMRDRGWIEANATTTRYIITKAGREAVGR